jgi:DNA-binding NarL/FixJ family response regulator
MGIVKYVNADVILPDKLVLEIQKYIQGGYLYIPSQPQSRKKSREDSDSANYIRNRNENIRNKHKNGDKVKDLAEEFFLSIDSIKKIVYKKKV